MKKTILAAALVLLTGAVFAQSPSMMGPGRGPAVDWKIGTVVTSEYKKVTGQLAIDQSLAGTVTFKADGVEYQLRFPRVAELSSLKNGDTLTIEGVFTTVKSDTKVDPTVRPFKVTVNGKETDLATFAGRGGMMRGEPRGQDDAFGPRPGRGR